MTTPARTQASEPISKTWLKNNRFESNHTHQYVFERALRFDDSDFVLQLYMTTKSKPGWLVFLSGRNSVRLGAFNDTARLIKLIEALTGKEWPCK